MQYIILIDFVPFKLLDSDKESWDWYYSCIFAVNLVQLLYVYDAFKLCPCLHFNWSLSKCSCRLNTCFFLFDLCCILIFFCSIDLCCLINCWKVNCVEASKSGIYMIYSKTTVKLFVCITGILLELFDILL